MIPRIPYKGWKLVLYWIGWLNALSPLFWLALWMIQKRNNEPKFFSSKLHPRIYASGIIFLILTPLGIILPLAFPFLKLF